MIKAIFAMNSNRVIGRDNTIPWHCPEDLKMFWEKTQNSILIMGRLTWDSLPKKPLNGRHSVVVTRNQEEFAKNNMFRLDETTAISVAPNIELALNFSIDRLKKDSRKDIFVIGGANIFEQMLNNNLIDTVYLTVMHDNFEEDGVKLPVFENKFNWTSCEKLNNVKNENITVSVYNKRLID